MLKLFWCPVAFVNVKISFTFSVLYHLSSSVQDLPKQTQSYLRCCCFCSCQGDPGTDGGALQLRQGERWAGGYLERDGLGTGCWGPCRGAPLHDLVPPLQYGHPVAWYLHWEFWRWWISLHWCTRWWPPCPHCQTWWAQSGLRPCSGTWELTGLSGLLCWGSQAEAGYMI